MIRAPLDNPIITGSVRIYQVLLAAYPTRFRQEYGPQMVQVFRDCCLRAFRQNGTHGVLKLWALTIFDLLRSLIEEHLHKETFMTRSKFIRLSGWSLILGAVTLFLFILSVYLENNVYDPFRRFQAFTEFSLLISIWVTPVLLGIGLLGLRARYGDEVGGLGKNILLFGAVAGFVTNVIGFVTVEMFTWGWILFYAGNAVLLACLTIFGISFLREKPLPRWNGLPVIAGFWFPVLLPAALIAEANGVSGDLIGNIATVTIPLQCAALGMLGFVLQSSAPEEIALTA